VTRNVTGLDAHVRSVVSDEAVQNDREAADEDLPRAPCVQRTPEPDEVFELRRACVRAIVGIIHVSASSWVANR
jgi:hypothetical protein